MECLFTNNCIHADTTADSKKARFGSTVPAYFSKIHGLVAFPSTLISPNNPLDIFFYIFTNSKPPAKIVSGSGRDNSKAHTLKINDTIDNLIHGSVSTHNNDTDIHIVLLAYHFGKFCGMILVFRHIKLVRDIHISQKCLYFFPDLGTFSCPCRLVYNKI